MKTYQLNNDFIFLHENPVYKTRPYLSVDVPVVAIPHGKLAVWETELTPDDINFGKEGTGEWVLKEDNRNTELYSTDDGTKYDGSYNGVGKIPEGLTTKQRPTADHYWKNGEWRIDPKREQEIADDLLKSQIESQVDAGNRKANEAIAPLQDALDLGIATEEEEAQLILWKTYRVMLNRIKQQEGYPQIIDWPEEPL